MIPISEAEKIERISESSKVVNRDSLKYSDYHIHLLDISKITKYF